MLKAVLFDLDNTLVLYDEMSFLKSYFPMAAAWFADIIPAEKFADKLLQATMIMQQNDGTMSNRERFLAAFCQGTGWSKDDIWSRFEKFYAQDWDRFKDTIAVNDCAKEVFLDVRRRNLKIVIATNPIWPLIAQMKRLQWAGLADMDFALVTHIDNMGYCKPQLGYFRQISEKIGEKPEDCLMVGDDPANDMVAAKIGMKTFLTVDSLDHVETPLEVSKQVIGNNMEGIPQPNFKGPLACVPEALDKLLR